MNPQEIYEIERKAFEIFKEKYNGINFIEDIHESLKSFIINPLRKIAKDELYPRVKEKNLTREHNQNIQNWMKHKLYNCIRSYQQADTYEYSEDPVFLIPPPSGAADEEEHFIVSNVLPNICKSCRIGFLEQTDEGLACQQCYQIDETIFQGGRDKSHQVGGPLDRWSTTGNKIRKTLFEFYELNTDKISRDQINFIIHLPKTKNTYKNVMLLHLLQTLKRNKVNVNLNLKRNIIEHFEIKNRRQKQMIIDFN